MMREEAAIALLVAIILALAIIAPGHDSPTIPDDPDIGEGEGEGGPEPVPCVSAPTIDFEGVQLNETWTATGEKVMVSSPRPTDLNGDSVLDIVIGSGSETEQVGAVSAIDGATGGILWSVPTEGEMVGTATTIRLNGDDIDDVIAGGRNMQLVAIDGATGDVLWRFDSNDTSRPTWFQFYTGVDIGDIDGDGVPDLLQSNGGDPLKAPEEERDPGALVIISGSNGSVLAAAEMPDARETYMSPLVTTLSPDAAPTVLFGSGGETFAGSLWSIPLADVIGGSLENATELVTPSGSKGLIAPPSVSDLDGDGTLEVVAAAFDGRLIAVNGSDGSWMWNHTIGGESYSSPAIGDFDGDGLPDGFTQFLIGEWPEYNGTDALVVKGSDGSVLHSRQSKASALSSPLAIDFNGDGRDEILLMEGEVGGAVGGSTHSLSVIDACSGTEKSILNGSGFPISTPLVTDLDADGELEIVWASSDFVTGWTLHRGELSVTTPWTIAWGGYLGTDHDGHAQG